MNAVGRALDAADDRWTRVERGSVWSATALVLVAWGLMALNRFGGLSFEAPRAVARLALVGVWGWLVLSAAIWAVATALGPHGLPPPRWRVSSLRATLTVVGWAHVPVVALAVVVLIAAGAMQLLGPGLVAAVLTFAGLVPFALVTGVSHVFVLGLPRSLVAAGGPYLVWLVVVARHVLGQVQHLL